ncbi:MAG TPA: hypothetical protein VGX23_11875 [Actinocrinis sp.]|nr:hypothetical protein [Actinocrinis sp.]
MTQLEIRDLIDEGRRDYRDPERGRPVRTTLWHPQNDGPAPPVVLISHGSGGAARQMAWLAQPLAAAGFLAVSVDHHGNNFVDGYLPQGFAFEWERPRDLTFALDAIAADRALGPVGAAGFSSGGYTAAALVGARIDPPVLQAVADGLIRLPDPAEYPGLFDELLAIVPAEQFPRVLAEAGRDWSDPRVRAAFLICPASRGFLTKESLAAIDRPVQIRWGDADTVTPPEQDALRYLDAIPSAGGRSAGEHVEHYDFLGTNPAGQDVRRQVAAEAVDFFRGLLVDGPATA